MRQIFFVLIIFGAAISIPAFAGSDFFRDVSPDIAAKKLGWMKDSNNAFNLCGGYYRDPAILYSLKTDEKNPSDSYDISADQTTWKIKGETTLSGHVRVARPNQELQGDLAFLYPNKETGKVEDIQVKGNLRLSEPGHLISAENGWLHLPDRKITLDRCFYRVALNDNKTQEIKNKKTGALEETRRYQMTAHGLAEQAKQEEKGVFDLYQASYTTCPPADNAWFLKAKKIHLNRESGRGESYHGFLFVKGFPVCYLPYFNFPIDKRRYSGFLLPTFGSDSDSGFKVSAPFYLNLAPNYDATITPTLYAKRGIKTEGLFRYLTHYDSGQVHASFLPDDSVFSDFQRKAITGYASNPSLHRLESASDNRRALSWGDQANLGSHWSSRVNYNYVSDDYYIQDFSNDLLDSSDDQLIRQGKVNYQDRYWNFSGNFQNYQTLHPVNRDTIHNQYGRIPQFKLIGDDNELPLGLDAAATAEYDYFTQSRTPGITSLPVTGDRTSLLPSLRLPMNWFYAYVVPRAQVQMVKYHTQDNPVHNARDRGIAIPLFDVDSGLNFEKSFSFFNHDYRQVLEPRLYYLYVPYRDQDGLPIFDTTAQTFNYDTMFQFNRFSGVDRMGDANQVTAAVMTRFIDANTGDEKGDAGIGQIRYFRDRRVSLCSTTSCSISSVDTSSSSPIAGVFNYHFTPTWTAGINAAWSTQVGNFVNESVGVKYQPDEYRLLTLNYQWLKGNDQLPGLTENTTKNDLKQTDAAGYWRLNDHWSIIGRWNYNWSYGSIQAFYYGLAYESCCWAVRAVSGRTYLGSVNDTKVQYRDVIYLQFALKGLGRVGEGDTDSLLAQTLSGYVDKFGKDN